MAGPKAKTDAKVDGERHARARHPGFPTCGARGAPGRLHSWLLGRNPVTRALARLDEWRSTLEAKHQAIPVRQAGMQWGVLNE
jgi:hypothetical protein